MNNRPFWFPDMKGLLGIAIVLLVGLLSILIFVRPIKMEDQQLTTASMILGVLLGCFKDVYGWAFGSSSSSDAKTQAQNDIVNKLMPPGPAVHPTEEPVVSPMRSTLPMIAMFILLASIASVQAQTPPRGPIGRAIEERQSAAAAAGTKDLTQVFEDIRKAALPDLQYASKLAKAAKPPDAIAAACWDAWAARIEAEQGGDLGPEPDPHFFTTVQKLFNVYNSLQPDSPFIVGCAPLANKLRMSITQMVGLVVSGGAGLAKLLPVIP